MSNNMLNSSKSSGKGGNTITPFQQAKTTQKQISPSKRWCFTFNNYTEEDISSIVPQFQENCEVGLFSKETGESGTPHLQGYVEFKNKCRPKNMWSSKVHWEKSKGNRQTNITYCSKDNNIIWSKGINDIVEKKPMTIDRDNFYSYQEELVKLFEVPCDWDDRTIYWRYGDVNIGKTQFAKWLCVHLGAVVIGGSHKHMLAQVQNADAPIYIVLLSYGDEKVSYRAIEQIKDGLFSSSFGCDNNKMSIRDAPHILILGNEQPDYNDRNYHPTKYNVAKVDID